MLVKIDDDCYVEIYTEVSESMTPMNGWSKNIQPEPREPGGGVPEGRIWLNQHIDVLRWN